MTVNAVGKNDNNSCLGTVIRSTAIGTAVGYSMKYLWPINKEENSTINKGRILNMHRKNLNEKKVTEFKLLPERTPAKDCFIAMVEQKSNSAFSYDNIKNQVNKLGGPDSINGKELKTIIRDINSNVSKMSKLVVGACKMMLKFKRPAIPFLVAGAGIGFLTGFTQNILKTDV